MSLAQCFRHLYHVVISNDFQAIELICPRYDKVMVSGSILPGQYQYVKQLQLLPGEVTMLHHCYHGGNHGNASRRKRAYDFIKSLDIPLYVPLGRLVKACLVDPQGTQYSN